MLSFLKLKIPCNATLDFRLQTKKVPSFRDISSGCEYLQIAIANDMLTFIDFSKRRVSEIFHLYLFDEIAAGCTFSLRSFHRRFIIVKAAEQRQVQRG